MTTTATRIVCFSAYSQNLRARALIQGLGDMGFVVRQPQSYGSPGSILELVLTLIPYCLEAIRCQADLAVGFKPHLNVTLPLLLCKLRGIPTWLDVDDLDYAYRDNWISRFLKVIESPLPRRFEVVSYHNDLLYSYLVSELHCHPKQLLQIEQGVSWQYFGIKVSVATQAEMRKRFGLTGRRVALYVAHLNLASDLDPVLRAWQQVVRQVPDGLLWIVGGGPRQKHFEALAQDLGLARHIRFAGEIAHIEVPACLAVADVALLYFAPRVVNSYRCSLKLREYCAGGVKVVCNDVGELRRFAHLTYQSTSEVTAYATMLARILQGHGDRREQTAREFARTRLDWRHIVAGVAGALHERLGVG